MPVCTVPRVLAFVSCLLLPGFSFTQTPDQREDHQLDQQLQAIAAAHHGKLAVYAHNLRTGQTA